MASSQQIASKALRVLRSFLPTPTPPSLDTRAANLYRVLSRYPRDGVGMRVSQTRWGQKGIAGSYWLVTRTKIKSKEKHGKAWGKLYWKGMCSFLSFGALWSSATFTRAPGGFYLGRAYSNYNCVSRKFNLNE
jgi:hypothetical protein